MKRYAWCVVAVLFGLAVSGAAQLRAADNDGWISLFDGKDLNGWKASENQDTFSVKDGEIVVHGKRSHLFYVGPVEQHDFKNFDFKAVVMTKPGANSGIYFHTKYQDDNWPQQGFEVQVNNTHKDPKKTGGLYGVKDVFEAPAKDNEWFTEEISVRGTHVTVRVNGNEVMDWTEPAGFEAKGFPGRKIGHGTFALQGHDPNSEVHYKSIEVRAVKE